MCAENTNYIWSWPVCSSLIIQHVTVSKSDCWPWFRCLQSSHICPVYICVVSEVKWNWVRWINVMKVMWNTQVIHTSKGYLDLSRLLMGSATSQWDWGPVEREARDVTRSKEMALVRSRLMRCLWMFGSNCARKQGIMIRLNKGNKAVLVLTTIGPKLMFWFSAK